MTEVNEVRGKDKRTIRTTEGLVERIDETYSKNGLAFYSSFKFGDKKYKGVFLAIRDLGGLIQHSDFPREFSPPERDAIIGKYVFYKVTKDLIYLGGSDFFNRVFYELVFEYKGQKNLIERIICFDTKNEEEKP